jgi:hypothetical protein
MIVTGPGAGEANPPLIRTFGPVEYGAMQSQFYAYAVQAWGANVGCGDLDGDGFDEIVTVPGPDPDEPALVLTWSVSNGTANLVNRAEIDAYQAFHWTFGGTVAGGAFAIP